MVGLGGNWGKEHETMERARSFSIRTWLRHVTASADLWRGLVRKMAHSEGISAVYRLIAGRGLGVKLDLI